MSLVNTDKSHLIITLVVLIGGGWLASHSNDGNSQVIWPLVTVVLGYWFGRGTITNGSPKPP